MMNTQMFCFKCEQRQDVKTVAELLEYAARRRMLLDCRIS